MISRRTAIGLIALGTSAIATRRSVAALDYPTRPVRFMVGYPPGGATDILARLIGQRLSERLGQQFVIENKPGAGNNIGTETAVNAEPDGYTVLLVNPANFINATLYTNLRFNFVRDIAAVACFNRVPNVMTVNKDVPANNVAEFIGYVKANPGKVNMASSGNGTSVHLSGEMFMAMTGALSGCSASDHRPARRPGAGDFRQHALDHPAYPFRLLARAGRDHGRAVAATARRAGGRRDRSGL
jgi:tripartite-type tricarboxylate transporter receptor subunit TctC